jgi:putative glutamine amidotransferase
VHQAIKHEQSATEDYQSHTVRIKPRSLLHELAQQKEIRVNSFHHQAIRRLAPTLSPVATAPDGVVEAVEIRDQRQWVLGVQWHPEIGWETDALSQRIFASLVKAARNGSRKISTVDES